MLRVFAAPRDRDALSIVLVASFVSTLLVHFVTHEITGAWKLAVPGAVETLTIIAMLQWARNRTGYLNSGALCIAWLAHVLCYLDIALNTDIVYSRYETILALVAAAQILACYDTLARCWGGTVAGVASFFHGRNRRVHHARACDRVAFGETAEIVQTTGGTQEIR